MESPHLTHDQIARLAAGDTSAREEVSSHLSSCEECRSAVSESGLWHAMWGNQPEAFADSSRANRAGRQFINDVVNDRKPRATHRARWLVAGASLAAVTAAILLITRPDEQRLPFSLAPVTAAIEETALKGRILIPGAERAPLVERGTYRSGFVPLSTEIDSTLHQMAEAYIGGSTDSELALALIGGYLAVGQTGSARDFVRDARVRFPADERFLVFDGLVDYCEGRLAEAEAKLGEAVARNPDDSVAKVNLAYVMSETGRVSDAMALARSVRAKTRNPVLAARADSILAGAQPER